MADTLRDGNGADVGRETELALALHAGVRFALPLPPRAILSRCFLPVCPLRLPLILPLLLSLSSPMELNGRVHAGGRACARW